MLVHLACLSHGASAEEAGQRGCRVLRDAVSALVTVAERADTGPAAAGDASGERLDPAGRADPPAQCPRWRVHLWRVFYTVSGPTAQAGGALAPRRRCKQCDAHTGLMRRHTQRFLQPCSPDATAGKPCNVHVPRSKPALGMFSEDDVVRRPRALGGTFTLTLTLTGRRPLRRGTFAPCAPAWTFSPPRRTSKPRRRSRTWRWAQCAQRARSGWPVTRAMARAPQIEAALAKQAGATEPGGDSDGAGDEG